MYFHTCDSVHVASGLTFTSPNFSSHWTMSVSARVGDWSRRMPLTQAVLPSSARTLGSTLRMAQHESGSRAHSPSPCFAACCDGVSSDIKPFGSKLYFLAAASRSLYV